MREKFLAGVLSLCLLAGMMPAAVRAEESGPVTQNAGERKVADEEELIAALSGDDTELVITVTENIELTSAIRISGDREIVLRGETGDVKITFSDAVTTIGADADYSMFYLEPGADVSMKVQDIILDAAGKARIFYLGEAGDGKHNQITLEEGGVLQNGHPQLAPGESGNQPNGGAVRMLAGSAFIMNGGKITGNISDRYGGALYGWSQNVTVEINGGVISDNTGASYAGGIVLLGSGTELHLYGGTVTRNKSNDANNRHGGGIFFEDGTLYLGGSAVVAGNQFNNGEESDVYLNSSNVQIYIDRPLTGDIAFSDGNISWANNFSEILAAGDYTLTQSDAAHLRTSDGSLAFYLDTAGDEPKIKHASSVKTLTFDANYPGSSETFEQIVPLNIETGLIGNSFSREGYVFMGWNTKADGNGTKYNDGAVATFGDDTTLYAQWITPPALADKGIQMFGGTALRAESPSGAVLSNLSTEDTDIITVSDGEVTPREGTVGQTAKITADMTYNGYTFPVSFEVVIVPRILTYTLADGSAGSGSIAYPYAEGHHSLADSLTFRWKDNPDTVVELTEGTEIDYTYTVPSSAGGIDRELTYDYLPMPVGIYKNVAFNMKNPNYTFARSDSGTTDTLYIAVNVEPENTKRAYLASVAPKDDQRFLYDGTGKMPVAGTLNAYSQDAADEDKQIDIGTFTVNIEGLNETTFHSEVSNIPAGTDMADISGLDLPVLPGTYIITVSAVNDAYYIYKSQVFTIQKGTVTVKASDKNITVGEAAPDLSDPVPGKDYTVSGLAKEDSLGGTVTLSYQETPDTASPGTYTIQASGGEVDEELYTLQYQTGTLTVSEEPLPLFTLTVENGSGSGSYVQGNAIVITADPAPKGKIFDQWVSDGGGVFEDAKSATTLYTMPGQAVTVTATYKDISTAGAENDKPQDTDQSDEAEQTAGDKAGKEKLDEKVPGTGDNTKAGLWVALALVGAAGAGCAVISRRRRR